MTGGQVRIWRRSPSYSWLFWTTTNLHKDIFSLEARFLNLPCVHFHYFALLSFQSQSGKIQLLRPSLWILSAFSRTSGHIHPLSLEHLFMHTQGVHSPSPLLREVFSTITMSKTCLPVKLLSFWEAPCFPKSSLHSPHCCTALMHYTKTYTAYQIEVV